MRNALPLLLLFATGCVIERGDGHLESEERDIDGFDRVANSTMVDVTVVVGPDFRVEVSCDSNLLDHVETVERNHALVIETPPNVVIRPRTDCTVEIEMPALDEVSGSGSGNVEVFGVVEGLGSIRDSGSGDLYVSDIDTTDIDIHCSGSGRIHARGIADFASLNSSGSGGIDAEDLVAADAEITCSGSGDIHANVEGHVDVHVSGSGDVVIWGEPEDVSQQATGSGNVIIR